MGMTAKEFKDTLQRIKKMNFDEFLYEDGSNEKGLNPQIVIQVVDENFEYGYWDYFYKSNLDNPKWFNEFNKKLKKYLKDVEIGLLDEKCREEESTDVTLTDEELYGYIDEINLYVAFYDVDDTTPYAYWDCLNGDYNTYW